MSKAIRKISIKVGANPWFTVRLYHDRDGQFRWYCNGVDCETSGETVREAIQKLFDSYRGCNLWPVEFRASWL